MAGSASISSIHGDRDYFSSSIPDELALELNQLLDLDFAKNSQSAKNSKSASKIQGDKNTQASEQRGNAYLEQRLLAILHQWPDCIDPYIALFKFYFRTAKYAAGERIVWSAITMLARRLSISCNYRLARPGQMDWLAQDSDQRHFLFCLKALGVIRLRREKLYLARKVLSKLLELDPHDEIGGGNFLYIVNSMFDDDDQV